MKAPQFSGVYHTEGTFFVVSYPENPKFPNVRELIGEVFTSIIHARNFISVHKYEIVGKLKIHSAKLTGVVKKKNKNPKLVEYSLPAYPDDH